LAAQTDEYFEFKVPMQSRGKHCKVFLRSSMPFAPRARTSTCLRSVPCKSWFQKHHCRMCISQNYSCDLSFSGLKTSLRRAAEQLQEKLIIPT
jgi:hypothetical protein